MPRTDAEPTSLTRSRRRLACPSCGSHRVTALAMVLTDGTSADFLSCHSCETRSWSAAGRPLPFAEVLRRATKPKAATG